LQKTIDELLNNARGEVEVIAVLDGYWTTLNDDKRVRIVHLGKNRGMRGAINAGVSVSRGKFIARCDEHIMVSPGYDVTLIESCGPKDIVTGRRYFLDPIRWEIMQDKGYIDCEKLVIQDCGNGIRKFAGQNWKSRAEKYKDELIVEAQAMQGSFWVTSRNNWDNSIKELETEGYGPHYGDSHEAVFKTWKNGGKLLYLKNMWYAHKDRSFPRTHNDGTKENPANKEKGWMYSLSIWEKYWLEEIKPKWEDS
jgi:glycosyltransferase involved in cell wall biosynthesis